MILCADRLSFCRSRSVWPPLSFRTRDVLDFLWGTLSTKRGIPLRESLKSLDDLEVALNVIGVAP